MFTKQYSASSFLTQQDLKNHKISRQGLGCKGVYQNKFPKHVNPTPFKYALLTSCDYNKNYTRNKSNLNKIIIIENDTREMLEQGPGREKGDDKQRRDNLESRGFLKKLPHDGHMIVPTDVRDQAVGELDRRQGNAGGVKGGVEMNRPQKWIRVLFLSRLGELQDGVPYARHEYNLSSVSG